MLTSNGTVSSTFLDWPDATSVSALRLPVSVAATLSGRRVCGQNCDTHRCPVMLFFVAVVFYTLQLKSMFINSFEKTVSSQQWWPTLWPRVLRSLWLVDFLSSHWHMLWCRVLHSFWTIFLTFYVLVSDITQSLLLVLWRFILIAIDSQFLRLLRFSRTVSSSKFVHFSECACGFLLCESTSRGPILILRSPCIWRPGWSYPWLFLLWPLAFMSLRGWFCSKGCMLSW